ncbi:MAG: hypothetical protein WD851_20390 [Pirellulales bacterium]
MTLILAMRTPAWCAIASDRMLSEPGGRTRKVNAVKIVQYFNDMIFGYTGIARMMNPQGRVIDTALFLSEVLSCVGPRSVTKALEAVQANAKQSLDRLYKAHPSLPNQPLAFLGVGWERDENDSSQISGSFAATISNFVSADGTSLDQSNPSSDFYTIIERVPPRPPEIGSDKDFFSLSRIGCQQSAEEIQTLVENTLKSLDARAAGIDIVDLMKQSIRATSKRLKNKYVGADVLAAILPKSAPLADYVASIGPQGKVGVFFNNFPPGTEFTTSYDECPTFFRFHPGRDDAVYHAPHVVATHFANFGCLVTAWLCV